MNAIVPVANMPFSEIERLAVSIARSGLFGMKTPEQAVSLMMIAQAEGVHPALAARDYDIIQGRPSKKAEAMLRDFLSAGGRVEWHELSDATADATFSHPQGGKVRITWDKNRVKQAGLSNNPMHSKYPRQMLRSRTVSEGVRTVWPGATSGMYVPEETQDMPEREAFTGTTIEAEPQRQPDTGEAIGDRLPDHSAPHPLDERLPSKWLINLDRLLKGAVTRAEVEAIAAHPRVETALQKMRPDGVLAINDLLADAFARFPEQEERADEPLLPEVEIAGEEKVFAG